MSVQVLPPANKAWPLQRHVVSVRYCCQLQLNLPAPDIVLSGDGNANRLLGISKTVAGTFRRN